MLKEVELVGSSSGRVPLADVVSVAGLEKGSSLLELRTGKAARRIESLPWVSDARVERIIPSRIRVRVVERKPAYVAMDGGTPWVIDTEGVVLEQRETGLLHLLDLPLPPLRPGQKIELAHFKHVAQIVDSLPPGIRNRLNRISAASIDRITLELTDGTAIIYGAAEQMEDKNHAVRKLLELYDGRSIDLETVDVRVPSRPAVKPRAAG